MERIDATTPQIADVVIIGAGISGLVAARRLRQSGTRNVIVLEASDRVGGRTLNLDVAPGIIAEGGGQWVGPGQDHVLGLIDELGLSTFKTHIEGRHIYHHKGRHKTYKGSTPPLSPQAIADYLQLRWRLERMARTVPADAPWTAPKAMAWDAITFGQWLDAKSRVAEAKWLFTAAFTTVNGEDPHCTSLLRVLHTIRTCGGVEHMINVTGGSQESRITGGSQQICLTMAADLGDQVVLNAPVTDIIQDDGGVLVRATRLEIRCKRVIVAMAPGDAERIRFAPELPTRRAAMQRRWHNGTESKLMAVYDRPFWRDQGLSGQALTDLTHAGYVIDNSPPDGRMGILLTFMGTTGSGWGANCSDAVLDDPAARADAVLKDFTTLFGPKAANPVQFLDKDWVREPWIQGCVSTRSPGLITSYGDATREAVGRIHWAGTEAATTAYDGYMEGAVIAAIRAVREVQHALSPHEKGMTMPTQTTIPFQPRLVGAATC